MAELAIPAVILCIVITCLIKQIPLYSTVVSGAEEGIKIVGKILPTLIVILTAISMLNASGVLDCIIDIFEPITRLLNIPKETMPLVLMRPISGSGALGILTDILSRYGPDTRIGMMASVIMGSTETTFYTLAVYFGATGVKNVSRAIPCALIGDLTAIIVASFII